MAVTARGSSLLYVQYGSAISVFPALIKALIIALGDSTLGVVQYLTIHSRSLGSFTGIPISGTIYRHGVLRMGTPSLRPVPVGFSVYFHPFFLESQ
jgi:hypothetical protein